ncbi:hypothetical protein CK203_031629 [Vitis vinifera]|uniref:Uncharacterized protein n=1 Tax=Vitis vinifera TaxID=29760 RepID=A0A438IFW3_VITVI|nr:hypothetical protein CK203_031629 [Vitis vinifera]
MFRFVSPCLDYQDHMFDEDDSMSPFPDLSHVRCHTGAYSVSEDLYGFSQRSHVLDFPRHHFSGPWRRSFSHMSITASITRPRYIVFASLTIIPELFIDMSSQERRSRLVESLLAISSSLRFAAACHTGAYFPSCFLAVWRSEPPFIHGLRHSDRISVSTFRVVITSQFDVQSHHHHFSISAFRAIIVSDRHSESSSVSAFRVVIASQLRCSESSSLLLLVSAFRAIIGFQIDIQSRILEPSSVFRSTFRVPSSVSAFRVVITSQLTFRVIIITSQFRRSELSSIFRSTFRVASSVSAFRVVITSQFGVQSHHHYFSQFRRSEPSSIFRSTFRVAFSVSAFRVVIASQLRCSESSSLLLLASAFRAIIGFQIDIQSRILEPSSVFRSTFRVLPRFRHSESLSLLSLTFRVIIITSQFRRSELSSVFRSTFRVASSVSAFRVVITSQFDVQSHHHHFLVSTSRSITVILFRLPEPPPSSCLGFQSHCYHLV